MNMNDPFDLSGELARDDAVQEARLVEETTEQSDWQWLMNSARGRRVLAALLDEAGQNTSSFRGDGATDFREGKRAMGLHIESLARRYAPERYGDLMMEMSYEH